jgi:hypothetical protein
MCVCLFICTRAFVTESVYFCLFSLSVPSHLLSLSHTHNTLAEMNDNYFLIRQEGFDAVSKLKSDLCLGTSTAVISRNGCGKSSTLAYLAQFAAHEDSGWLLLTTHGQEFPQEKRGFVYQDAADPAAEGLAQGKINPAVWHQPRYAADWLASLPTVGGNTRVLKTIPVSVDEYPYLASGEAEDVQTEFSLLDLVNYGATKETSVQVLADLMTEIRKLDPANGTKVLVLVDDYNVWDERSDFYEPVKVSKIPARQLGLVRWFDSLVKDTPKAGAAFFAHARHNLLRRMPEHIADADAVVEVAKYSDHELATVLHHYKTGEFLHTQRGEFDERFFGKVKCLTGGNPKEVFKLAFLL